MWHFQENIEKSVRMTEGNNTNLTNIKATTSSCGKCEFHGENLIRRDKNNAVD